MGFSMIQFRWLELHRNIENCLPEKEKEKEKETAFRLRVNYQKEND